MMIKNLILLLLLTVLVHGDVNDNTRFYNSKSYSLPFGNIDYTQVYVNGDSVTACTDDKVVTFTLEQVNNGTTLDGEQIQGESFFFQSAGTTSLIGSMAVSNDGTFYGMATDYFFKLNNPSRTVVTNSEQWSGFGGYYYNGVVYLLSTPADKVIVIDTTAPFLEDQFETIDILTQEGLSFVVDQTSGLAFIGDYNGGIQIFDSVNNIALSYFTPENAGDVRYAGVVDSGLKRLFYCTGSNGILNIDIFSYENVIDSSTPLIFIESLSISMPGVDCSSAAIDTEQGQLFFGIFANSGLMIVSMNYAGDNQDFVEIPSASSAVQMVAVHDSSQLQVYTDRSLLIYTYHSICENDCSGHGECLSSVCVCTEGYFTSDCSQRICLNNCTDTLHGTCSDGTCICTSNFTSPDCSVQRCPDNCFDKGTCSGAPLYQCSCFSGYNGTNCANQLPEVLPPCSNYTTSDGCVERIGCGWCHNDGVCMDGDRYGPYEGFCRTWYFDQNVETGVIILASIFIALIGILFLIDIFSTIPLDRDRAYAYSEEFTTGSYPKLSHEDASILWWRDQRSAKAWTLMDQFQFLSLISHLGVVFPSRFLHFTEYLDWTNLGIPFPSTISPPESQGVPTRQILSMYQYDNSLGVGPLYQLANILFWFGLLVGAFLVPLLIIFAILSITEKSIHYKEVMRNRIIHITLRLFTFGYIGVLMSACYSMVSPIHDYQTIIPGAILFILYGIGYPLGLYLFLNVPETRLHNPTFKQQFGQLYVNFKPKSDHRFFIFAFAKRFVMATIIGILAFKPAPVYPISSTDLAVPIVQVIVIVLALGGYCTLLIIRKPYFDHFHLWLEYFLTGVNVVTVALCLTHIKSPSVAGELIAWILQALALVACIAAYLISWVQMKSMVFEKLRKIFKCCSSAGKSKKSKEVNLNEFRK